jgi:class 3 adenylate cyclase/predicted ATPase
MNGQTEIEKLQQTILALEAQRLILGDPVVDTALVPLREKLATLQSALIGEQRKMTTILFADLVDFTALSAKIDSEELRDLLKRYFSAWNTYILEYGGIVEKYIGDAVMAVFGLPLSREDDPERAVMAALGMAGELEQINQFQASAGGQQLYMRVGIHTGEVVVGSLGERLKDEFVVVGEAVNLTSRIQAAAPPGRILITQDTYRHIRGLFDVLPFEINHLKDISEPVQTYLIQNARPHSFKRGRRGVEGIETSMVGRESELIRLQEIYKQTALSRKHHMLILVGDTGIGKTRLLSEFEEWVNGLPELPQIFKGRAFPSTQNTPFSLARDTFAFRFKIQDSDPLTVVKEKLELGWRQDFLEQATVSTVGERAETEHFPDSQPLGRLLGFYTGLSGLLPEKFLDARGLYDQALIDLRSYFRSLAGRFPVILLLEDLHWADDSSLKLLKQLGELPVLVFATTRPVLAERRPDWETDLGFQTRVDLTPLTKNDSLKLTLQILHKVRDLPETLLDLITSSADGNPFYIEELVKMLIEDEVVMVEGNTWQVQERLLSALRVPPTLVGVLQARLDSLQPEERQHLQRGAVIGRIFWDRALEYLDEGSILGAGSQAKPVLSEVLLRLQGREMIFHHERSTFEEAQEYIFKHALLRDVTYESLLKKRRREYHRLAAEWLEQATEPAQRGDQFASTIASHYEQAGKEVLAAAWYWRSGQEAARRYANSEALHAYNRALTLLLADEFERRFEILMAREAVHELMGQQDKRSQDLDDLSDLAEQLNTPFHLANSFLRRAAYSFSISEFPAASEAAQKVKELVPEGELLDLIAQGSLLQASVLIRQGDFEAAIEHAQQAMELARQQNMPALQANSLRHLGLIAYYLSKHQEAHQYFEQAYHLYLDIGDRQGQGMALNNLGGATFKFGDYMGAQGYYTQSFELCREIGDRLGQGRALNNLGITSIERGDYDQAEDYYLQSLQICREIGHRSFECSSLDNLGNLAAFRYQYSKAQEYQLAALQLAREIGDRVTEDTILLNLGHTHLLSGSQQKSFGFLKEAEALTLSLGDEAGEAKVLINLSDYELYTGDIEGARLLAFRTLALTREHGMRLEEGQAEHCLASAYLIAGEAAEAVVHYRSAIQIYTESSESDLVIEAKAGLAESLLALGQLDEAAELVEEILPIFQKEDPSGFEQPILIQLTCFKVLKAKQDSRAEKVLEQSYQLLQEIASRFKNPLEQQAYLEDIPANRALLTAWQEHHD